MKKRKVLDRLNSDLIFIFYFQGKLVLLVFYPQDMVEESEATMNLLTDMALAPELDLALVAVSTDSLNTHRAWAEKREGGVPPVYLVSDKNGDISRTYGVLDVENHRPFHAVFIIDTEGVMQGARVSAVGGLHPSTASDMLDWIRTAVQIKTCSETI